MVRNIIKKLFNLSGFQISRIQHSNILQGNFTRGSLQYSPDTMQAGLHRSYLRGIRPNTVIDVGAAEGKWTLDAMKVWSDCDYLLLEPLQERKDELTRLEKTYSNIHFVYAGAGDRKGTINFFVTDDLDGSGIADNGSNAQPRTVEITTIDDEANNLKLKPPYAVKLDTHGYEVPILTGAAETLKNTELIIIECYGFQIAPNSLLFWEMCQLMQEKGFRLVDIVDIMRRDKDQAFWQCDAFFIPEYCSIFKSNTYH